MSQVEEIYLSKLHEKTVPDGQQKLGNFDTEKTNIAVVSDPTGQILDVTDEYIPELGMPMDLLNELRERRASLNIEDDVKRHNTAVKTLRLEKKYRNHVSSDEAKQKIEELVGRVNNGENITLVCFEKEPKWCHRYILVDIITEKAD